MTVSCQGTRGGRSSPHVKAESITQRLGHAGRVVALVEGQVCLRMADAIAEVSIAPAQLAFDVLGVRLDQQLVGIEAMAVFGVVGAMHAIAV